MQDYVTHFSQISEMLENSAALDENGQASKHVLDLVSSLKEKVELNRIKKIIKNALMGKMQSNKEKRLS